MKYLKMEYNGGHTTITELMGYYGDYGDTIAFVKKHNPKLYVHWINNEQVEDMEFNFSEIEITELTEEQYNKERETNIFVHDVDFVQDGIAEIGRILSKNMFPYWEETKITIGEDSTDEECQAFITRYDIQMSVEELRYVLENENN